MKKTNWVGIVIASFTFMWVITACNDSAKTTDQPLEDTLSTNTEILKKEVWEMEELYWKYVQEIDTVAYLTLWHEDFIGYPSFGDNVADKRGIAGWIPKLHADTNALFSYVLYKKAVNTIDDVYIVFYDADEIWKDKEGNVVRQDELKFTHTWKKYDDTWLILGGMAAKKQ